MMELVSGGSPKDAQHLKAHSVPQERDQREAIAKGECEDDRDKNSRRKTPAKGHGGRRRGLRLSHIQ